MPGVAGQRSMRGLVTRVMLPVPMPGREGELIGGKYRLIRPLRSGGMGAVWTARHEELGVEMAVKFQSAGAELDPRAELRFRREARAAAQLKSPHVVQIHDFGIDGSTPY